MKRFLWAIDVYTPDDDIVPFDFDNKTQAFRTASKIARQYYDQWPEGSDACIILKKYVETGQRQGAYFFWNDDTVLEEEWDVLPDGVHNWQTGEKVTA